MNIKLIAEGSSKSERLIRRWGLSYMIGDNILYDTFGDSDIFIKNMKALKINKKFIKHIVLSHDDWDHVGGLWRIITRYKDITVHIGPNFNGRMKERIKRLHVKICEHKDIAQIDDNVFTTGELFGESKRGTLFEQSLVIKTEKGLVVVCGCAHPKVTNIVWHVKEKFKDNIFMLIGGFHLKDNSEDENIKIIKELRSAGINKIAPLHCTGKHAVKLMNESFGNDCLKVKEGEEILL